MATETAPKPQRVRAKRRDFQKINERAVNYVRASLGILDTLVDQTPETARAHIEGQRCAYARILTELEAN